MNNNLKKIIFVTQNLAPFRIDWIDELAKYFQIQIIYYNELDLKGKTNPQYMERRPNRASYIRIRGNNPYDRAKNTNKFIKEHNDSSTLIILDGYGFVEQIILARFLQKQNFQYGVTVDGIILKETEKRFVNKIKEMVLRNAEFVFSTSENTDKVLQYYGVDKNKIIRHIFTPLYKKDILIEVDSENKDNYKNQLGFSDKFIILSVGKMIRSKGFDMNLELAKRNPHLYFVIVGGTPRREFVELINKESIKNIKFVDFCDKDKLHKYYMAADVFFHPTRTDVWGLVINEALAHGLPIITTNKCGAGLTLIKNDCNGFVVEVDNIDAMEQKLNYFYENPDIIMEFQQENLKLAAENTIEKSTYNDFANLSLWRNKNE